MYSGTLTWQDVDCDDGGADGAFDFMNPTTIYATCITAPGVIKSTDGGATFSYSQSGIDASELTPYIAPALAMDPANSQRLYFAAAHVWQSNDGADTWTSISGGAGRRQRNESGSCRGPERLEHCLLGKFNGRLREHECSVRLGCHMEQHQRRITIQPGAVQLLWANLCLPFPGCG